VQLLKNDIRNILWLIFSICLLSLSVWGSEKQDSLIITIGEQNSSLIVMNIADFDSFNINNIPLNDKDWAYEISLNELKNNNLIIARININGYKYIKSPVIYFSGQLSQYAIYQDTVKLYSYNNASNIKQNIVSKVLSLNPDAPMVLYFVVGYRNLLSLPALEYIKIGERNAVIESIVPFPSEKSWLLNVILAFFIFTGGGIFFLSAWFFKGRNRRMLIYLALFALSSGMSFLLELFRSIINMHSYNITVLLLIFGALTPWAFIGFLKNTIQTGFRIFLNIAYWLSLGWCLSFPVLALHVPILLLYWGGIGFNLILITLILIKERIYKKKNFRLPFIGFIILFFLLVIECLYSLSVIPVTINSKWGILALILGLVAFFVRDVAFSKKQVIEYEEELTRNKIKMLMLENQNIQSQFQTLKNQVNPHFLFNSLNTLASLIQIDTDKAAKFVQRFSSLYRNILDMNDQSLISINKELKMLESYIYLQKMRKGNSLMFDFSIRDEDREHLIPPLALQLLIENAIKHNEISDEHPMLIQVSSNGRFVEVRNKLNPKYRITQRKGIGLKNLLSRYEHFSVDKPVFQKNDKEFIAQIPIITDL
jgi:sensor histidine kinase YesM